LLAVLLGSAFVLLCVAGYLAIRNGKQKDEGTNVSRGPVCIRALYPIYHHYRKLEGQGLWELRIYAGGPIEIGRCGWLLDEGPFNPGGAEQLVKVMWSRKKVDPGMVNDPNLTPELHDYIPAGLVERVGCPCKPPQPPSTPEISSTPMSSPDLSPSPEPSPESSSLWPKLGCELSFDETYTISPGTGLSLLTFVHTKPAISQPMQYRFIAWGKHPFAIHIARSTTSGVAPDSSHGIFLNSQWMPDRQEHVVAFDFLCRSSSSVRWLARWIDSGGKTRHGAGPLARHFGFDWNKLDMWLESSNTEPLQYHLGACIC
jgi:hypothetical protein